MSKKLTDRDFLSLSAMLRAREANMLSRERMERMLSAASFSEAAKLLTDCGYEDMSEADAKAIDAALSRRRGELFDEVARLSPAPEIVDVFRLKYDYHNIKVLLKAQGVGVQADYLFSRSGRIDPRLLEEAFADERWSLLPEDMGRALEEAKSVLARTGNPQTAEFELDRAYFAQMLRTAGSTGSAFITGYARTLIDSANLRTAVRTVRMGKDIDFLRSALVGGGGVDPEHLASVVFGGEGLAALYTATVLHDAAALGAECIKGGGMTVFERACDNAVSNYISGAKLIPFGAECAAEYLSLVESEITAVRMILTGRLAGIGADVLAERLRDINA